MKFFLSFIFLIFCFFKGYSQEISGQIFIKEDSYIFINNIFVTNLNTNKTIISAQSGNFKIQAKVGEILRFTSSLTQRKDIAITPEMIMNSNNYIELKPIYHEIEAVTLTFKPTGNLTYDVKKLKAKDEKLKIAKIIGLPEPKKTFTEEPLFTFKDGRTSIGIEKLFDLISGEDKKKKRLQQYEKQYQEIHQIKKYFGEEFFTKLKIPKNLITDFLLFIHTSDNISAHIENNDLEKIKPHIEKYLPIYLKRVQSSNIMNQIK